MKRRGFTLVELIFVIVIIGVLSAVAVPKFTNLLDNAKITSEISTAASVQASLDAIHAEWVTNRCEFVWSENHNIDTLNADYFDKDKGYPKMLELKAEDESDGELKPLTLVVRSAEDWTKIGDNKYIGPASNEVSRVIDGKPDQGDCWVYDDVNGTFELQEGEC